MGTTGCRLCSVFKGKYVCEARGSPFKLPLESEFLRLFSFYSHASAIVTSVNV